MRKLGLFKRLFMGWDGIVQYVRNNDETYQSIDALKASFEDRINDQKKLAEQKDQFLDEKTKALETIKNDLNAAKETIASLKKENELSSNDKGELQMKIHNFEIEIAKFKERINDNENFKSNFALDIQQKLETIGKIEKTFFASTGNKGTGELGELQIEVMLQKMGVPQSMWMKNLTVGSKTVEFAMASGDSDKWIPVDSKVLKAVNLDVDGNMIVDNAFRDKVKAAAKDVSEYLNKSNTAAYGILVLQSDKLFMELLEKFPPFVREMIDTKKIYITSPSAFIQNAWSLANVVEVYRKVHEDEKIYDDMLSLLSTVKNFSKKLAAVQKDFNIAMDKHAHTIENKQVKLQGRLEKAGKVSALPLDEKE